MTKTEKTTFVKQLAQKLADADYFYIIDATGLTVAEVNDFRRKCFQAGVVYQVAKNTLIGKALETLEGDVDYTTFSNAVLKGFSGILFAQEVGNAPAKVIQAFRKQKSLDNPVFKGACIDNALYIGEEHLEALSKLKSKSELIGDVIGLLQGPTQQVMASLQSSSSQLAGILETLSQKAS